jgi:hypothetical protein
MFIHVAVPDGVFTSGKGGARADFWRLPSSDSNWSQRLTGHLETGRASISG